MFRVDIKIPDNIRSQIGSRCVLSLVKDLNQRFGITSEEHGVVIDEMSDIYEKKRPVSGLLDRLAGKIKRPSEWLRGYVLDLVIFSLSYLDDYFEGQVSKFIRDNKFPVNKYEEDSEVVKGLIEDESDPYAWELPPVNWWREEEEVVTEEKMKELLQVKDFDKERDEIMFVFEHSLTVILFSQDDAFKFVVNYKLIQVLANSDILYLNRLKNIIAVNKEMLTEHEIITKGKKIPPTVANWVRDYIFNVGADEHSAIKRAKYLASSPNVKVLDEKDKSRLNTFLEFYRILSGFPQSLEKVPQEKWYIIPFSGVEESELAKLKQKAAHLAPSVDEPIEEMLGNVKTDSESDIATNKTVVEDQSPELLESKPVNKKLPKPKPAKKLLPQGQPSPISLQAKAAAEQKLTHQEIVKKYEGDPAEAKKIEEIKAKIIKITGRRALQIVDWFYKEAGSGSPQKVKILAALYILAQTNNIDNLLKDKRSRDLVDVCMNKKELNEFSQDSLSRQSYKKFLMCVLQSRLKLPAAESARIGLKIANILKQYENTQYAGITHFDMKRGEFEWAE